MYHQPAAPQPTPAHGRPLLGLCCLMLLAATFAGPSSAAAASGTVSLTIRLEAGVAGLLSGGSTGELPAAAGAEGALAEFAPRFRQSLEGRYQQSEIDRIVSSVTEHAIIVLDGEAFSHDSSGSTWLTSDDDGVFSL